MNTSGVRREREQRRAQANTSSQTSRRSAEKGSKVFRSHATRPPMDSPHFSAAASRMSAACSQIRHPTYVSHSASHRTYHVLLSMHRHLSCLCLLPTSISFEDCQTIYMRWALSSLLTPGDLTRRSAIPLQRLGYISCRNIHATEHRNINMRDAYTTCQLDLVWWHVNGCQDAAYPGPSDMAIVSGFTSDNVMSLHFDRFAMISSFIFSPSRSVTSRCAASQSLP